MEEIDYSVLFRWFVELHLDEEVWAATTFNKNRDSAAGGRSSPLRSACLSSFGVALLPSDD